MPSAALSRPDVDLPPGLTVAEVLRLDVLAGARVVAGSTGSGRRVSRLNVMEVPDILPWVRAGELMLTTGYPLRQEPEALVGLVRELDGRGLAAIGVKLGRYLDELPPQMLAEADACGLPVVLLPDGVGFDDVINGVLATVLHRRAEMLARSEAMLSSLVDLVVGGGDLGRVCAGLADDLGGTALVTSIDGRVIAAAEQHGAPSRGPGGGESADAIVARLTDLHAFDRSGRFLVESQPVGCRPLPGGGSIVVARVAGGRHDHGRLVVVADAVLGAEEAHLVERSAAVAALVLTKAQAVTAVESKYQADFLRDALAGRAGPDARVVEHARSLGWDLNRPLAVVVARLEDGAEDVDPAGERAAQQRFGQAWTQCVAARDPGAAVVGLGHDVVAVLGCAPTGGGSGRDAVMGLVDDLVRAVRGLGGGGRRAFSVGVSRDIAAVGELPTAYDQARKAVAVGRRVSGPQAVTHFDGLGVFRLLSLVPDSAELRGYVAETLGDLAADDQPEIVDLRHTLEVLLANNLNVAETARELHFHYNTLRYRIGKLERMVGPFTTDPHLRLTLALALQVIHMRGL